MENLSYNERLALLRFRISLLFEVKEAALIANDGVFNLLLDTLTKLDGRIELRRGFEYFRETPEDEAFDGFIEAELEEYSRCFWQICQELDKDSSQLVECVDAFAAVLASMYVASKNDDAFITKIVRHFCLWPEVYDYQMLLKLLTAFDYTTFQEILIEWGRALDEYGNKSPQNKETEIRRLRFRHLLAVVTELFDGLMSKNQ